MHPIEFPEEDVDLTKAGFKKEKDIFQLFKNQLSKKFHCFYSHKWKLTNEKQNNFKEQGEIDFIIVHPEYGVLLIELKAINPDIDSEEIYVNYGNGRINVFDKLERNRQRFQTLLKDLNQKKGSKEIFNVGEAVFFANAVLKESIREDYKRRLIEYGDIKNIENRIIKIYEYFSGIHSMSMGNLSVADISRILEFRPKIAIPLSEKLNDFEERIEYLTKDQVETLGILLQKKRVMVKGGAGTGKTILAMEKARKLANSGKQVLFICFNNPLEAYLKENYKYQNLHIFTFFKFCSYLVKEAKIWSESNDKKNSDYLRLLESRFIEAIDITNISFDSLIVDEAQDLSNGEWWSGLMLCLKDSENSEVYVFYDDYQEVHKKSTDESISKLILENVQGIDRSPLELPFNLRNTKEIFSLAKKYYSGGMEQRDGVPKGIQAEYRKIAQVTYSALSKALNEVVLDILKPERGISFDELVILTGNLEHSLLKHTHTVANYKLTDDQYEYPERILFDTVRRFKGLEKKVVILIEMDHYLNELEKPDCPKTDEYRNLLYLAITRAKTHLIIIGQRCI